MTTLRSPPVLWGLHQWITRLTIYVCKNHESMKSLSIPCYQRATDPYNSSGMQVAAVHILTTTIGLSYYNSTKIHQSFSLGQKQKRYRGMWVGDKMSWISWLRL